MNKTQANRLVKMIELIRFEGTRLNLSVMRREDDCGTVACVAGFLPEVDERFEVLYFDGDSFVVARNGSGDEAGSSDIADSLGIDKSLAFHIFNVGVEFGKTEATQKKRVMAALEKELHDNGWEAVDA